MLLNQITYEIHFFSLRLYDFYFAFRGCTHFSQLVSHKIVSLSKTQATQAEIEPGDLPSRVGCAPIELRSPRETVLPNVYEHTSRLFILLK